MDWGGLLACIHLVSSSVQLAIALCCLSRLFGLTSLCVFGVEIESKVMWLDDFDDVGSIKQKTAVALELIPGALHIYLALVTVDLQLLQMCCDLPIRKEDHESYTCKIVWDVSRVSWLCSRILQGREAEQFQSPAAEWCPRKQLSMQTVEWCWWYADWLRGMKPVSR